MRTYEKQKMANAPQVIANTPCNALKTLRTAGEMVGPAGLEPATKAL